MIMKEVLNAYKGIKESMHIIMEEEEMYEQSVIGTPPHVSDHEENSMCQESSNGIETPSRRESLDNSTTLNTPMSSANYFSLDSSQFTMADASGIQQDFNEPDQKDGHLLFSVLRGEIVKAFSLKSSTKADSYLDRITFIARKMINIWFGRETSLENFNMFVDLLKEKAYLISFPFMLESFRKMNCFELDPNGYQPFCELILASLTEVLSFYSVCSQEKRVDTSKPVKNSIDVLHQRPRRLA